MNMKIIILLFTFLFLGNSMFGQTETHCDKILNEKINFENKNVYIIDSEYYENLKLKYKEWLSDREDGM